MRKKEENGANETVVWGVYELESNHEYIAEKKRIVDNDRRKVIKRSMQLAAAFYVAPESVPNIRTTV